MYCSSGGILKSSSGKYTSMVVDHKEITAGAQAGKEYLMRIHNERYYGIGMIPIFLGDGMGSQVDLIK